MKIASKLFVVVMGMVATSAILPAYAEAVTDTNDVTAVVVGWQRAQEALGEQLTAAPASVREYSGLGGTGTYYVVTLEGGGYVVTSGDTSLEPVLAYSKTGTWVDDVKRNPLMAMLEIDIAAAAALTGTTGILPVGGRRLAASSSTAETAVVPVNGQDARSPSEANAAKWAKYKAAASKKGGIRLGASAPNSDLRVSPLIESAWSQTGPRGTGPGVTPGGENYYTPGNVYCGCVATMCAQMMKYWEWPKGTNISAIANYYGSVIFVNNSYGTAVTNSWSVSEGFPDNIKTKNSSKSQLNPAFGGTYDWANMPLTTQSSLTDAQKAAIGKLTRDAGIACCMGYSNEGSGASGSIFAHRAADQFAYTSGQDVGGWNDANRDALLACLDAGIPCGIAVSHSSSGHAIIADGYGYNSSGTLYVHFNYGWGSTGPSDWYTPPSVGDYNSVNDIIVNVYPPYVSKYDRTIVSGRVFSNGSVQSSVTVTATNRETGFSTNVTSNTKGIYSFMLPRGYYTFSATKNGSSAKLEADVKLGVAGAGSNAKSGNIHGLDLNLGTAVTAPSVALTHRWSFAGNLNDSVGSSTATKIGSNVNIVDGKAVCTGNGAGQGSLNLGSNLLDTDGATIEIWAANDEVKGGSRIFEYGVDTGHYFMMAWTKSTDLYVDCAEAFSDGANNIYDGTLAPFTLGRQYHIAVTFERQGDGTTKVRATRRDAASGAIQRVAVYSVTNGIHTFSSPILRLGRSFQGNADARATYDEVRVWQGVLSDAQLKASALAGPDANLSTLPWNASAVRYVAKAIWQGGTTAPTASSLASSANWSCTDQNGDAITGVPDHRSVVIIPNGSTAFTIPEGFTPNWRKLQIGSEGKATAQWGKKTYTQTSVSAQLDPTSADYTLQGDANVDELARSVAPSVQDAPAGLSGKQFRYDGWVYVTAAQAGRWAVSAYADDYAAFRLDDEWLAFTRVMDDGIRTAVADVPKGWHRFTIIIGDYYGGFGGCAMTTDHSRAVPVLVSIDGGNGIAFTSSNFQFGSPDRAAPVVTLAGDADWSSIGEVSLDSGAELDLNGHTLTIDKMDSSFLGANIKDTSATPGTIAFAEGGAVNSGNITVQSDVKKAYANAEELITAEAAFWLDASDVSTITTNASGEVTQWNSRVGNNYAKQSTGYATLDYPTYDTTTYGIPTVDFGAAKSGKDLRFNVDVSGIRTVFWVTKIQRSADAFWLGLISGTGSDYPFSRGEAGQYTSNYSGEKFAKFWNGTDAVSDMLTECPPDDQFIVVAAEMKEGGATANSITQDRWNIRNGGKQLSELIVFNRVLSDEERNEVTQYLQTKWFGERSVFDDAIFWLDASDVSTITTNASGEVTRWNSRVGSNYATQGRHYYGGSTFLYPTYDATTYGIPTIDFGSAVQSGWGNDNPGMDLNINTPVAVKTVFFATRIQNDGKAAWLGQEDAIGTSGNCFRRDENGAYNDKRSGQPGQSRFANFWIGTDVISDMTTEHPPADRFCVFSAQMDDSATYTAEHLAAQCGGLHSGGKQLSELIIFNRALSDAERTEVTRYLQMKWLVSHATLTHRWSFNGSTDSENLRDSVGGLTATKYGNNNSWSNGKLVMNGNGGRTAGLNLGTNIINTTGATVEIWGTLKGLKNWGRIFDYACAPTWTGSYAGDFITWTWTRGAERDDFYTNLKRSGVNYEQRTWQGNVEGIPYHFALTVQNTGSGMTVKWTRRNATTGAIEVQVAKSVDFTLNDFSNPEFLLGVSAYNDSSPIADYDEVRIWDGVLSDEQLTANVIAGPDVPLGGGMGNVIIAPGDVFVVNGNSGGYGYRTDSLVSIGAGAKIRFDTTGYFGRGLRFKTGGFILPSGSVLDFVELSDAESYVATMEDADTILVQLKSTIPYESTWSGAVPSAAADLVNPANWTSVNAQGATISAVPTANTTVIIPSSALPTFSIPSGATVNSGRVILGGYPSTQCGRIAAAPNGTIATYRDSSIADYTSLGATGITELNGNGTSWQTTNMKASKVRFDGWFYVTAAQAGKWTIVSRFDDVSSFAIDGVWLFANARWDPDLGAGAFVSEGWHRFTMIAGDNTGGYGSSVYKVDNVFVPFTISINGGAVTAFYKFTFGTDNSTVTLSQDCDWRALGEIMLNSGLTIDLNGHNLSVAEIDSDVLGAVIKDTSGGSSTLTTYTGMVGTGIVTDGITLAKTAVDTATWTGAYGDNDVMNPGNWNCYDSSSNLLPGALPTADTTVTVSDAPEAIASSAAAPSYKWLDIGTVANKTGTVTIDEGSSLDVSFTSNRSVKMGTVNGATANFNVNGGNVTIGSLNAPSSANSAKVAVNVTGGTLTITGWTDFGRNSNANATFNQTGGTVESRGNFWFGRSNSGTATYNLTGGNLNFTAGSFHLGQESNTTGIFNQGGGNVNVGVAFSLGQNTGSRGFYNMTGGNLQTGNVNVGDTTGNNNTSASGTIDMKGGTYVATGYISLGHSSKTGTAGTMNVSNAVARCADTIHVGYGGTGTLNIYNGGDVTSLPRIIVGSNGGTGSLNVYEGGKLVTPQLSRNKNTGNVMFAGGTIVATNAVSPFFKNLTGITLGKGGMTVDSAGQDIAITTGTFTTTPGSMLRKVGAGKFTMHTMPSVDKVKVEGGTLALSADADNSAPAPVLAHRWSFTGGSLADSVGSSTAEVAGSSSGTATLANNAVTLPGGNRGTCYVDLGNNVFPASGAVTLEIWATQNATQPWSRMFAIGSDDNNKLAMFWTYDTNVNQDAVQLKISGSDYVWERDTMQPYTLGTKYHISMVIVPGEDGKSTLTWTKRDAATGEVLKSGSVVTSGNWKPADFASRNLWLGHGYSNNDAAATYDEVRIWNGALGEESLTLSAQKGPDAAASELVTIAAAGRILELAGGTLDLGGHTLTQPYFTGVGTVQNGTLNADVLNIGGDGTSGAIALNVSSVSGVIRIDDGDTFTTTTTGLDLSGATIDLATTPTRSFVVGTASGSGSFAAGRPALTVNGAPLKGWMVKKIGNTLKVSKGGVMILAK